MDGVVRSSALAGLGVVVWQRQEEEGTEIETQEGHVVIKMTNIYCKNNEQMGQNLIGLESKYCRRCLYDFPSGLNQKTTIYGNDGWQQGFSECRNIPCIITMFYFIF